MPQYILLVGIICMTVLIFVTVTDFTLVEAGRNSSNNAPGNSHSDEHLQQVLSTLQQLSTAVTTLTSESTKTATRLVELQDTVREQQNSFDQFKADTDVKLRGMDDKLRVGGTSGGGSGQVPPRPPPPPPPPDRAVTNKPPLPEVDPEQLPDPQQENTRRKDAVRESFLWAWNGYKEYAWGADELSPLTKRGKNWPKNAATGFGLTILDSLSTLWILGLEDEFERGIKWVKESLNFDGDAEISVFESTIRMVAGLLSAYELSGEKEENRFLVTKAQELTDRLLWAYNTTTGIPHASINLHRHTHSNPKWTGGSSVLSEFGTVQLEFRTLSYHTKNDLYDMKGTHIMQLIKKRLPPDGLPTTYFNANTGKWTSHHITLGALGDSYYEYLLKQYLLTGKQEPQYKDMFEQAANSIVEKLVKYSHPSGQVYIAEHKRGMIVHKMDHLACFAGGMFSLGAQELYEKGTPKFTEWMKIGDGIGETCHQMYATTKTGLSPEIAEFRQGADLTAGSPYYILRPETVETYFYMWRWTRDQKWRDYGWAFMRALNHWCKVDSGGYSGLKNVNVMPPVKDDLMQSFFLAETLKYLYLLFSDDDALDLKEWVFNTEAHPLKIRKRVPPTFPETPIPGVPDGYEEDVPNRGGYAGFDAGRGFGRETRPTPPGYVLIRARDAPDKDISTTAQPDRSLPGLAKACDENPVCQGFNTNGYLKKDVSGTVREPACDLYVKQQFAGTAS